MFCFVKITETRILEFVLSLSSLYFPNIESTQNETIKSQLDDLPDDLLADWYNEDFSDCIEDEDQPCEDSLGVRVFRLDSKDTDSKECSPTGRSLGGTQIPEDMSPKNMNNANGPSMGFHKLNDSKDSKQDSKNSMMDYF